MLERYGIVTRETVLAEGIPGGFSTLYAELGNLELLGTARRGYFVEGLGGAQFALPGAVERLRSLPEADGDYLVLAATDPANPYGASLPWPKLEGGRRPGRTPGAYLLLRDGEPVVFVERGGRGLLRLRRARGATSSARRCARSPTPSAAGQLPKLAIEKLDGEAVIGSGHEEALIGAGFSRGPRKLTASGLTAPRRCHNRLGCLRRAKSAVELLRSVPLFADLEEEELERFSHVAVPRTFPAGTRVFHEGDSSDACYIVSEGSFRVTREHSDGRAITLATLGPGEIFGELAMLDGDQRSASAESLTDGELLALPADDVRSAARPPPGDRAEAGRRPRPPPARRQRAALAPVLPDRAQPGRRDPLPAQPRRRRTATPQRTR